MTIHKSAEDYLEAMLMLKQERGYIRSIDVAEKLSVTKPSVSYATKRLRESGYISFDPAGMILLLPPGQEIAERMYERHMLLTELLIGLGVDPEVAREDACKIEHDLSVESFDAIRRHAKEHR
ncbi:MAG: metal-dependent transcriptional regulator [Clostridia bacterium]|nr:metal-dependent transcriptional regulator [Clostridia bacterium]